MRSSFCLPRMAVIALVLQVLAVGHSAVLAQEGPREVFRGRQAQYEVAVGVQPERPRVGAVHFVVTPINTQTGQPVTDARVVLVALDESGVPTFQAFALNSPVSRDTYASNITFDSPGAWTIEVRVQSAHMGDATLRFPLEIEAASSSPGPAGAFVLLGVMAFLGGAVAYLWYSSRRASAHSAR